MSHGKLLVWAMSAWSGELTYAAGFFLWNPAHIFWGLHLFGGHCPVMINLLAPTGEQWTFEQICCFLFRPYFTKPLAFAEVALRWWTNQTAKCGKWESRATSEIFVATEVIRQPVALISGSRAQIATRVQKLWMESQRNAIEVALQYICSSEQAMQSTHHHHYFILQYILPFCVLRYCKTSPVLMDYCVLSLKAGAQQGSLKTSVLNSKPVMRSNKHQEIGCFTLKYL